MNIIKYALFIAALSLPVTNTHALEWVDYDGTIPDNAVSVNEGTEDRPICRKNERIGVVNDSGRCRSVKIGSGVSKKDDFQILVDTYNWQEVAESALGHMPESGSWTYDEEEMQWMEIDLQAMHEEILGEEVFTQTMLDDAVDDAVADATSGLIPPGDCGNSEEEAFEAGVAVTLFYVAQKYGKMEFEHRAWKDGSYSTNYVDSINEARKDYLNGRCENVPRYIWKQVETDEPLQLACESFNCHNYFWVGTFAISDNQFIPWSDLDEEVRETYCSNALDFEE